jgi:hypothetical protein
MQTDKITFTFIRWAALGDPDSRRNNSSKNSSKKLAEKLFEKLFEICSKNSPKNNPIKVLKRFLWSQCGLMSS